MVFHVFRFPLKILRILAMMIFALPNLPWTPTDHLELFAGQRAVTSGEIEEWGWFGKETTHYLVWEAFFCFLRSLRSIPQMDLIYLKSI